MTALWRAKLIGGEDTVLFRSAHNSFIFREWPVALLLRFSRVTADCPAEEVWR